MTILITDIGSGQSVSDILRRVRNLLQDTDEDAYRWLDAELLDWVNDAANAVVVKLPTARAVTENIVLADGALQVLPSEDAILFLNLPRNLKADGSIGRAIRVADRQLLDDQEPDWYLKTRSERILH